MKKLIPVFLILLAFNSADAQWQKNNASINYLVSSLRIHGLQIMAGTAGGEIFTSINNGDNWKKSDNGMSFSGINDIAFNTTKIYAITNGSGVYCSTDNGSSWMFIFIDNRFNITATALFVSDQKIIVGDNFGYFFISNDNGLTWNDNHNIASSNGIYSLLIFDDKIYAGTGGNGIFVTQNEGITWSRVDSGLTNPVVHSLNRIGSNIIAGTDNGIFISSDTAKTWRKGIGSSGIIVKTFDNNGVLAFASTDHGVYVSADRGNSWSKTNFGLTDTNVYSVTCNETFVFAGTNNCVWKRPLTELPQGVLENDDAVNNISIYPNPTSGELRIQTSVYQKYFAQLFDLRGKLVNGDILFAQNVIIDLTEQMEGIYFLVLKDDKNRLIKTLKVAVIK